MPITVVFDFPNDTVDRYRKVFEIGGERIADQPTRLHHQCFDNGDGFTVIDVWESEDDFAMFGEVLGPVLQELGLSTVPKVHRTHRIVTQRGDITDY